MPAGLTLKVGNGVHNVSLFVRDAAGNTSPANTKQITVTPPKPTVAFKSNQRVVTSSTTVPMSVQTTDPGGTGIKWYFFANSDISGTLTTSTVKVNGSTSGWILAPGTWTIPTGDGLKTVYAWVRDGNNTISNAASVQIRLDTTIPVATLTVTGSPGTSPVVTVAGTDTSGSGIKAYAITLTNVQPDKDDTLAWYVNAIDASNALSLATGTQTVYGWVIDNANNISVTVANTSSKSVTKS
jgi:hypothetical protein